MIDAADARISEALEHLDAAEVAALTRDLVDVASPVGVDLKGTWLGMKAFLVSDEASYITGASLVVDGGYTAI